MVSFKFLSLVCTASYALGSPLPPLAEPILAVRANTVTYNASLPNVTIFATGGTIAGAASSSGQTTGYQAGAVGIAALLEAVPEIVNISNVQGVQVASVGSESITPSILLNLTQLIQKELDSPYCQGVVITHGTDTLEESAFFLDLTIRSEKPVVFVGAMRPSTAISADGPINLLEAVTLAADPAAKGRGAMIVLNDRIANAYFTTKTNANALDTFKATEQGFLGFFINIKPKFYYHPALPLDKPYFDLSGVKSGAELPQVDIIYGYQALNPAIATAAVASGAKGLVLAGMGAGGWTDGGNDAIEALIKTNKTPVIYSRRTMDGYVEPTGSFGIGGGFLNPQKARIMLQLALHAGYGEAQLKTIFEYYG
ncbi:L-asparaginase [Annulohypoxylon maeteangense]|uniref:L-asparaginase n=1 Tax=Annulohypoxylon maeteangense TaxID=1927788 RepID=UPI002007664C|nr:L-asparaginase [Annulohypoxylon maeteangense]KAI0886647.1 L-asparaginase [Annulohypoxylon maeteangense]